MSRYWFRARRFLAQKVLHTNDTPHAIALGAAIAALVAFLPLIGLQTIIAVGLAALLRANKAICIPIVWITNPFTLWPIYGACFGLGRVILASPFGEDRTVVFSKLQQQRAIDIFDPTFWKGLFHNLATLGLDLWVGCIVVGTVAGIIFYFVARRGVSTYRERRRQRLLKRALLRSNIEQSKVKRRTNPL